MQSLEATWGVVTAVQKRVDSHLDQARGAGRTGEEDP